MRTPARSSRRSARVGTRCLATGPHSFSTSRQERCGRPRNAMCSYRRSRFQLGSSCCPRGIRPEAASSNLLTRGADYRERMASLCCCQRCTTPRSARWRSTWSATRAWPPPQASPSRRRRRSRPVGVRGIGRSAARGTTAVRSAPRLLPAEAACRRATRASGIDRAVKQRQDRAPGPGPQVEPVHGLVEGSLPFNEDGSGIGRDGHRPTLARAAAGQAPTRCPGYLCPTTFGRLGTGRCPGCS